VPQIHSKLTYALQAFRGASRPCIDLPGGPAYCSNAALGIVENDGRISLRSSERRPLMMSDTLLATLFIGGFVLYGAMGTIVVRKLIHRHIAEGHNDVLVPLFLTAGVIYAVLLGFMVVGEWESYDAARANAGEEAAVLVPLYRQTTVMDAHGRDEMRKVLREYAEHVVQGWQRFANGERNRQAGHDANALLSVIGELKLETKAAFTRLGRL